MPLCLALSSRVDTTAPAIDGLSAVAVAVGSLGLVPAEPLSPGADTGGRVDEVVIAPAGVSREPIPARLMYVPTGDGEVRLAWRVVIREVSSADWWSVFVDARSSEVLELFNWTVHEPPERRLGDPGPRQWAPFVEAPGALEAMGCSSCYRVFALPLESPSEGGRNQEIGPADSLASPFGWHDTNGSPGAEFTDSRGNNVEAQTDLDANDSFGPPDLRASGGAMLNFDFPLDLGQVPAGYQEAAVTQAFYMANRMHDIAYRYGFDEAAGNFQVNNYGNGGVGGDPVQADVQDGFNCNSANFATPPDGSDGRMQMLVWVGVPNTVLTVNAPASIAGDYDAAKSCWGEALLPP